MERMIPGSSSIIGDCTWKTAEKKAVGVEKREGGGGVRVMAWLSIKPSTTWRPRIPHRESVSEATKRPFTIAISAGEILNMYCKCRWRMAQHLNRHAYMVMTCSIGSFWASGLQ
jgi:hypothetical protein